MKHPLKLTIAIITMFIITQLIGLYIVNFYITDGVTIPYGFDNKEAIKQTENFGAQFLGSIIISFIVAILLIFFLMKINASWIIRIWFFTVIAIAIGIFFNAIAINLNLAYPSYIALAIGLILAYLKMFRQNPIIHNLTEMIIYPGIAAIFVVMLNWWIMIILLLLISAYDIWAVWHSGVMQKMAKYQMENLGMLGGFMIPYASKKIKEKIKLLRLKYKSAGKIPVKEIKKHKIKVALAILGGGDIVFPIIAAGVFFKTLGMIPALCVTAGAALALIYLLVLAKPKKFYPAMPYLTAGILLGMLVGWLISIL